MAEKISIITISYNSVSTIERTFRSILAQSYRPLEYVLVDGESKDGTISIIEKYIPLFKEAGIDVNYKSEPDKGISDAFNKGIMRASGDIIGIINADDELSNDALNYIVDAFDADTYVVCGDCMWKDTANKIQYVRKSKIGELGKLKYEMVLMHPTCFVRKLAYQKYGVFDLSYKCVMDKDLMARFYRKGAKFRYTPHIIAIMYSGGVSDTDTQKVYVEGVRVAVKNGVPKWCAEIRWRWKAFTNKTKGIIKSNRIVRKAIYK